MSRARAAARPLAPCVLVAAALTASTATAQEPDSLPGRAAPGNCTLTWEPIDSDAELLGTREDAEAFISRFSGRMLFTCGTATMEADSTVKYDRRREIDFIGNVVYRDTIRTLRSRFLTYLELQDLVIARDSVELVRIGDGSRLRGPRVEFLRAVSGLDAQTTATGRPHMTFYPEGEEPREPFEIDADRASFAGEAEARFHGDVVIARSDLDARADSAYLRRDDGTGVLWGRPWVETEEIRLEGDTIRFRSEEEELRDVRALGDATASGEQFDVHAERIDAALEAQEVEEVWAHGEGLSEALSGGHELYGDSMRFVLFASQIDTVISVGSAAALQRDSAAAGATGAAPGDVGPPGQADTLAVPSTPDSVAAFPESDSLPGFEPPDSLLARRVADSLPQAALADSLLPFGPLDSVSLAAAADTAGELMAELLAAAVPGDSLGAGETTPPPADSAAEAPDLPPLPMPRLATDGSMNWVTGDTLFAIFARAGRPEALAAPDSAAADSAARPPPAEGPPPLEAAPSEGATAMADPAAADSASDPVIERLIAISAARSFYRQVRDSTVTDRPSRNYMLGSRIEILFEGGEPVKVRGRDAIGIYLEPEEAIPAGADTTAAAGDTVPGGPSAAPGDTVPAAVDSAAAPRDTLPAGADTTGAAGDTLRTMPGAGAPLAHPGGEPVPASRRPPRAAARVWRRGPTDRRRR